MSAGSRICLGLIILGVGLVTLFIESIPIIWTGGLIVGIFMIISGLKELATGEQYKCKRCDFTGKRDELLRHALLQHESELSESEKNSIRIALGIQQPASVDTIAPSLQPEATATNLDPDDTIRASADEEIK